MQNYLFFDSNRLLPGFALKKGARLSFKKAVFYARQLVNAGFFYKETGKMPESLEPDFILKTEDDFLFLDESIAEYSDFDENAYLGEIKKFFYSLVFGEEKDSSKTFQTSVKNYSGKFGKAIDSLDKSGNSLVSFSFVLDEVLPSTQGNMGKLSPFSLNLDYFSELLEQKKEEFFVIFPYSHLLSPFLSRFGLTSRTLSLGESVPFGSYNRFAQRFFYLDLPLYYPEKLPDVDSLWKKIEPLIKEVKDDLIFFELGEQLDFFSVKIFRKIKKVIPGFKVFILEKKPFSEAYHNIFDSGEGFVFNPKINGNLNLNNYLYPEYSFQRFLSKVESLSSDFLVPFLLLLQGELLDSREDLLLSAGLNKKDIEELKNGKCSLYAERKGLCVNGEVVFSPGKDFSRYKQLEEIVEKSLLKDFDYVLKNKDFLKKIPEKLEFAEYAEKLSDIDDNFKGFFWYCADNYKKAVTYLEKNLHDNFREVYAECLYFLNRYEELTDFCEKNDFYSSFYFLVRSLQGEKIDQSLLCEYCALELAFSKRDFESLKDLLDVYLVKDAVYFRFYAIWFYYASGEKDFEKYFDKAVEKASLEHNFLELSLIYKHYGNALYYKEDFFQARDYFLKSMKIAADIENEGIFSDVEYNLAHIDTVMCNLDKSFKYFYRAYLKIKESSYFEDKINLLSVLGKIKAFAGRPKDAEVFLLQALELAKKKKFSQKLTPLYYLLTVVYQDSGEFEKSEYYLNLFEKSSKLEFYKKEIPFKRVELLYFSGRIDEAKKEFLKWKPENDYNKLHPFLHRWFEVLLFEPGLSQIYDFYKFTEKCPLKHTVFLMKTELLRKYPQLVFVLEDEVIDRDYKEVIKFNIEFSSVYRESVTRKKKLRFDSELFVLLEELREHSERGEVYTVKKILEQISRWAGLNKIEILPYEESVEKEWETVFKDSSGRLCLVSDTEVDSDFYPLFHFILGLLSEKIKFVYSPEESFSSNFRCGFLNEIIGKSEAIEKLKENLLKAADFNVPVLIEGESGTGKELAARALHYCSSRHRNRFVPVNCAAIPHNLLESELFGFEKGAFSGADRPKKGLLEFAGEGTVFLDEIGEMPLVLQAKLLRVLQEREFTPLGSVRIKKVNARFVFATNKDLKKLVKEGKFREDLFYRISAYTIKMPTLNERREDIPLLAEHFLRINEMGFNKSFSYEVLNLLKNYNYKGNVRELQNIVTGALILSGDSEIIEVEHLPDYVKPSETRIKGTLKEVEDEFRRNYIKQVIARYNGNVTKAAQELGISRQRLHQLRKQLEI